MNNTAEETLQEAIEIKKVTAITAREIAQHFDLQEESLPFLNATDKEEQTPADFLQTLMNHERYHDAINFLTHGMPVREAVWWACLCARDHFENSDESYQQALIAAENWVQTPTEAHRREAEQLAESSQYNHPASWVAAAAFWSGDSIAPVGDPIAAPPPYLYAHAVSGAIVMAAGLGMPSEVDVKKHYQRYLKHGINIANGGNG